MLRLGMLTAQRVVGGAQAAIAILPIVIAPLFVLACGGNGTTPSPLPPQFIHFTLNSSDNRAARHLQGSYLPNTPPGFLTGGAVNHQTADAFTPIVTSAFHSSSWHGV